MRILVLYASDHGQTAAIANAVAARLEGAGHRVDTIDIVDGAPPPSDYGAVLLGSRIHMDKPARAIRRYVQRHRDELAVDTTGFFTVSMSAAAPTQTARRTADACLERSLRAMRWAPRWTAAFGGGLPYLRYGRVLRWMMSRAAATMHEPTDTARDHDLTDWSQVTRFADEIATDLSMTQVATSGAVPAADGDGSDHARVSVRSSAEPRRAD